MIAQIGSSGRLRFERAAGRRAGVPTARFRVQALPSPASRPEIGDRHTRRVPSPLEVHDMERTGTLDQVAAMTHVSVDVARIHSYEALSVSAGPYYATLFFNADAIVGEVVSNVLLPADQALSPGQEHRLETLGWMQPDDEFRPSFHRTWSTGAGSETIVRDLLAAFVCVADLEEGDLVNFSRNFWCGAPGGGYPCRCAEDGEASPGSGDRGPSAA